MTVSLDKHDREIILLLQKDGRMSYVEMAKAIGVTEGTIRRKMHRLIEEGVIKVAAVANPYALGFKAPAIIGLHVNLDGLEETAEQLAALPGVRYVAITTGNFDIILEGYWADNEQLSNFLLKELPKVPGINGPQTSLLLRIVRQSYDWGIPGESESPGGEENKG